MLFSNIIGLNESKEHLIKAINSGHVAHAQLFMGKEGTANLALALAYATYLNCENRQENDACGTCPSCRKMINGVHPDVHFTFPNYSVASKDKEKHAAEVKASWRTFLKENPYRNLSDWSNYIEAENKQCIISVDEGREIIKGITLKAFESEFKIVLIWLPELMNQSAANSILKVLEEPPEKTIFLLVTNDKDKNLTTILSRCQLVNIPRFSDEEIGGYLKNRNVDEEMIQKAISLADGNLNLAIKLSEDLSDSSHELFRNWMRACFSRSLNDLVEMADTFQTFSKENQKALFQYGINIMRELLLFHSQTDSLKRLLDDEKKFVDGFAKVVTIDKVPLISDMLGEASYHVERNASPKITFMNLSLQLTQVLKK